MPFIQTILHLKIWYIQFSGDDGESNSGNERSYSAMMGDPAHTKEQSSVVDKKHKY
jgi:hypothetical protein